MPLSPASPFFSCMSTPRGRSPTPRELGGGVTDHALPKSHLLPTRPTQLVAPLCKQLNQSCADKEVLDILQTKALWESVRGLHEDIAALRHEMSIFTKTTGRQSIASVAASAAPSCVLTTGIRCKRLSDANESTALDFDQVRTATGSSSRLFDHGPDAQGFVDAIRQEREERVSQMADFEARFASTAGLCQKMEAQASRHEELIMHMWQDRPAKDRAQEVSAGTTARCHPGDVQGMLEILQQRLREEVSSVIKKHQNQYAELKELITRVFSHQSQGLAASVNISDRTLRKDIERLVRVSVEDALARHGASLSREPPSMYSRLKLTLPPPTTQPEMATIPPTGYAVDSKNMVMSPPVPVYVKGAIVPVMDAAALAAQAAAKARDCLQSSVSPITPPQQNRTKSLAECASLHLSDAVSPSPAPAPRVAVPQVLLQQRVAGSGGATVAAAASRASSGSRNSTRSWPAATVGHGSAQCSPGVPPAQRFPTPTAAASTSGSVGPVASARVASYAQRRRLATSRGAVRVAAPAPTSLYGTRSAGCVRMRTAR